MTALLVLPVLIPLATAALSLMLWRHASAQRTLGLAGSGALLAASIAIFIAVRREGVIATQIGAWPAPFGITLVVDLFSAIMLLLAGITGLAGAVYASGAMRVRTGAMSYFPLLNALLAGVCGAFITGDLFNMYVWFEVMLISSFVLQAAGGERSQLEGGLKYMTLNLISSMLFLSATGLLYSITGTLNFAHLAGRIAGHPNSEWITALALTLMVAFGIKAAIFPVFFWLPAAYPTAPIAVSAVFAGLLTKVGVYALIRVFTLLFVGDVGLTHGLVLALAGFTMITGVFGAITQQDVRRILSFHIISQIGYMIMGLGLYTTLAVAGSIFYIAHHIIVKTNLFLIAGLIAKYRGSFDLKRVGGVAKTHPLVAAFFLIAALSLAGMPPLSGFFAKLMLLREGLREEAYIVTAAALIAGILTLYSMSKIWAEAFWKAPPEDAESGDAPRGMVVPVAIMAAMTVTIGLSVEPLFQLSYAAAEQLMNPAPYISAVLGASR
jgi:multicomponent Na+:H+ antiporter subunit D